MGRISRNMIGCATVLVWSLAAAWLAVAAHPIWAVVVGAFAVLRLWVLIRDWSKGSRRRSPPPEVRDPPSDEDGSP